MPIRINVTVDDDATPVLRKARQKVRGRTNRAVKQLAERTILPAARRRGRLGPFTSKLVVRTRYTGSAFLTGQTLKAGRAIGLLEFGGTRRDPIRPRKRGKQAVMTPRGPRAAVLGPRKYKKRGLLIRTVEDLYPAYERELLGAVLEEFDPLETSIR